MTLAERPSTPDERLAERIARHFLEGAPFPEGEEGFSIVGHEGPPPQMLGQSWQLSEGERWLAHALGSRRMELDKRGFFGRAGSAAALVTSARLRLLVGDGGVTVPTHQLAGQAHPTGSSLRGLLVPYGALEEVGPGDLLFLKARGMEPLVLRVPFPRSLGALITGLWGQASRQALPSGHKALSVGATPLVLDAPDRA